MGQQDQINHNTSAPIEVNIAHDLNWLLQSQPLMAATANVDLFHPQSICQPIAKPGLQKKTLIPLECLKTYPAQPAYRLGKHFEDCVDLLFAGNQEQTILNRNIVIQTPQRTLGELDLLYRNAAQEIVHLELAIKFYLLEKDGTQLANFIGPAGIDRLDLKWQRMCDHQLPLSQQQVVIDYLQQQHIPLPKHRQLLLTGMLFYPYGNWKNTFIEHLGLHPKHQRGWWLGQDEVHKLKPTSSNSRGFLVLPKWHWIAGPLHYPAPRPIGFEHMQQRVTADRWPNMVLVYERTDGGQAWQICNRGLII